MDVAYDENACVICLNTEQDGEDIRDCLSGIPKLAEYWDVCNNNDLKSYLQKKLSKVRILNLFIESKKKK